MSVIIDGVKCACSDCVCVVDLEKGATQDGRIYCGDACAEHHKSGSGCEHAGSPAMAESGDLIDPSAKNRVPILAYHFAWPGIGNVGKQRTSGIIQRLNNFSKNR
jgi:hypothetical protein